MFNSSAPNVNGQINLNTEITARSSHARSFSVSPFVLNATLNGPQFPQNGLTFNLQATLR